MPARKAISQFGLWESPITPISLGRGISFSDVAWDTNGSLVWLEGRSGRGVLVMQPADGQAMRDMNSDYSARASVGYGGGDFTVGHGTVYFAEAFSGRLYRQPLEAGLAKPITPAFGRSAAPALSPDGRWLLYVNSCEGRDVLAMVDAEGSYWPVQMVSGDDFYMQPCWHPDGKHIAWISWNHPNMPWDGTVLHLGVLDIPRKGFPALRQVTTLAGDDQTSIFQPQFSPDGRWLAYISDQTGWWQIYLHDLNSAEHIQLTHTQAEHGKPAWLQGLRTYGFSADGRQLYFIRDHEAVQSLWAITLDTRAEKSLATPGYTSLSQPAVAPDGRSIVMIASGADVPPRVITRAMDGSIHLHRRGLPEDTPSTSYAVPQHISWFGMDQGQVFGLHYTPRSDRFEGIGLPPLVVMVHGGPTSQRDLTFNPGVQFFTSRGYTVLDVNYRGSTGYGRDYRDKLRGNWGCYDVDDSVSGARFLAEQGLVDPTKVVIMGGSAGGFTVLKALEDYPGFFKAGICLYGISNQFTAAIETHKFEAHYYDLLLGTLPQAAEIYRQRSPIFYIEKITDPIILFQGEDDVVVPRAQSDEVAESLKQRRVPYEYYLYPGEGHGFRKTETIEHMYTHIELFLKHYVIFA